MLSRRALIRAGFADHRLLTLTMACVACRKARNFSQIPKLPETPLFKEFSMLIRRESSQGAAPVWFGKPDASWPKAKSRAAGHQLSTCGAAWTSTLASITSWAC
jgi:hypothetical protein